jgi:putative ABC transport system permease protein
VLPALTLVLTLTLAAFAAIISGSVTAGQEAASWQQVGADVLIQTGGQHTVTAAAGRAVGAVPGIRHTAAVYTVPSSSSLAATLIWPRPAAAGPASAQVGLTVVDPPQYAALAAGTPWPGFRPALLARDPARTGAVPVLATPGLAAAGRPVVLELDGTRLPVMIVGRIGATAAVPAGGSYVVLPSWAAPRLPALPGPRTLLATGTPTDLPALRAAIARTMPGSQLTLRQQVLAGVVDTPAQRARTRLSLLAGWTAAAFSAVALLFALAVSARPRDRLLTRLSALGMTPRQAGVLALADTVPLLCVAIIGMLAAVVVLALLAGPALNLTVFTGSAVPVPVRPDPLALLIPAAAVAVLTVVIVATERAASGRHDTGTALRHQEVM